MRTAVPALAMERPSIRVASFEDYDQIVALERRVGLTVTPRGRWLDLWLRNPAYTPDWPIGWVLKDRAGRIVGCIVNVPSLYYLDGRKYLVATLRGWGVDVKYRAFSLMLLVHDLQHPKVDVQLTTTAGRMSEPVLTRLGWSRLGGGQWSRTALWVADHAGMVGGYLRTKMPSPLSIFMAALARPPLRLFDSLQRGYRRSRATLKLEWCTSFDERFDLFWSHLKERRPDRFLCLRSREALDWHFQPGKEQDRIWILTASAGEELDGYAVFQRRDVKALDVPRMIVADLQTRNDDAELCSSMLRFALERCRLEGICALENQGCWLEGLQRGIGPRAYHRDSGAWPFLYKANNPELAARFQGATIWYPTLYDGDASL